MKYVWFTPWKKAWPFLSFVPSLKLAQLYWRRYFNFVDVLSLFHYFIPLEVDVILNSFNNLSPENVRRSMVRFSPMVFRMEKRIKIWKIYQTDGRTDGQMMDNTQFSIHLRWTTSPDVASNLTLIYSSIICLPMIYDDKIHFLNQLWPV